MYGLYDSMLPALEHYKSIASLHPDLASRCLDTADILASKIEEGYNKQPVIDIIDAVANNANASQEVRDRAKALKEKYQPAQKQENGLQMAQKTESHETASTKRKIIDKQKALDFMKKGKVYAGGKKLFERVKNSFNETFDKNPKLATTVGLAAMVAGCQTMNPALAAAGAAVMIEGLHHIKNKMLEKRGLRQSAGISAQKPTGLQMNISRLKGLKYDGR